VHDGHTSTNIVEMLARRLLPVLLLAAACTPAQDTKQAAKQATPEQPAPELPVEPKPELPPQPASGPTYALVPGEAIGPVRVGMSKAEIEALGVLATHPQFSGMTIPISVYYDEADKAKTFEISLTHTDKDVTIGEVTIPKTASIDQIRELLGDCKDPEVNIGATMYPCRGGTMFIAIGSGSPSEIWLRTGKSPTYTLIPGERIGHVRIGMSKAEIEALGILETHPQFSAMTIPISVYYDEAEKAKTVEISLTHSDRDVMIGEVAIPRTASVDQIRELLGDCEEPQINKGGTMHPCRAGAVLIAIGSGNPDEVWLRIDKQ
jgi:hypothetical protein